MGEMETPRPVRATDAQIKYIKDLVEKRQLTDEAKAQIERGIPSLSKGDASRWIDALLKKPVVVTDTKWEISEDIPDGRYAIQNADKVWVFYRVKTRDNGTRILSKVLGAPGDFRYVRINGAEWRKAIEAIRKDPAMFSILFGLKVGACGICGSPLTDPDSIARGIGPICAQKYGW
jgi:hypothetical protein